MTRHRRDSRTMRILCVLMLLTGAASAQVPSTDAAGVAVYRYTEIGQSAITVDLLSAAGRSGRYFVEPGLNVLDLIVLSGGATLADAVGTGGPTGIVSVIRESGGGRSVVFSAPLSAVTGGEQSVDLEDGDLVSIRTAAPGAIAVDVWGAVGRTGRLEVEPRSTLLDVLAQAGGPALGPGGADAVLVSLSRSAGDRREMIYEGTLAELSDRAPPLVEAGDIVTVRVREGGAFTWQDGLRVVSSAASVAILVLRVVYGS